MPEFIVSPYQKEDIKRYKEAGASIILLAERKFSVQAASYFKKEDFLNLIQEAHQLGMKAFVLCNRMIFDEDFTELRNYLTYLNEVRIDGIYYIDLAVYMMAKELGMEDKLIYVPGATITNSKDALVYLNQGIKMVELANELTLDEKVEIISILKEKCEVIIHGRLVMSYSKRQLLSNYLEEIEVDRNVKDKTSLYIIEETRDSHMPIIEDSFGTHIYSGYTLNSFQEIQGLVEAGLEYLRIDSIFYDSEYVCDILQAYQAILKGDDSVTVEDEFRKKYSDDILETGFYYQKTNLVK